MPGQLQEARGTSFLIAGYPEMAPCQVRALDQQGQHGREGRAPGSSLYSGHPVLLRAHGQKDELASAVTGCEHPTV